MTRRNDVNLTVMKYLANMGSVTGKKGEILFLLYGREVGGCHSVDRFFAGNAKKLHLNKASPDAAASSDRKNIFHFQFFLKSQRLIQSCSAAGILNHLHCLSLSQYKRGWYILILFSKI